MDTLFNGADSIHVQLAPVAHGIQGPLERTTVVGQGILHFRWDGLIHAAMDDAVCLQLAKLLDEHLFRNAGNEAAQLGKAAGLLMQPPENNGFPFSAEDVEGGFDGAVVAFRSHRAAPSNYTNGKYMPIW